MSSVIKAVASALTVVLALTALAAVRPDVALSDEGHAASDPESTTTTAPPAPESAPAESTPTTAPAAPESPPAEPPPSTTSTTTAVAQPRATYPRLPRLNCRRPVRFSAARRQAKVGACHIERRYRARGIYRWYGGRKFITHQGRVVQGRPNHTLRYYRRLAVRINRQARVQRQRRDLVRRWSGVARCESGNRWGIATGNGYYGGLQFSLNTWRAYGGRGYPHQQPAWFQARIADNLRRSSGLHHWPHCGRYYG